MKEPDELLPEDPDLRLSILNRLVHCIEAFEKDAKARGLYVPPFIYQKLNPVGTIAETTTFENDGTTKTTKGGIAGIPPGAPDEFVKAQAEKSKGLGKFAERAKPGSVVTSHFNMGTDPARDGGANKTRGCLPRDLLRRLLT